MGSEGPEAPWRTWGGLALVRFGTKIKIYILTSPLLIITSFLRVRNEEILAPDLAGAKQTTW